MGGRGCVAPRHVRWADRWVRDRRGGRGRGGGGGGGGGGVGGGGGAGGQMVSGWDGERAGPSGRDGERGTDNCRLHPGRLALLSPPSWLPLPDVDSKRA